MKNILNENAEVRVDGRLKFTLQFVSKKDISNKSVLDIGCGYGWFERFSLENKVKRVVGIEISEKDLKASREKINNKRADFKVAGALKLPFPDDFFDTVVAWEVIEHIPKNTEDKMLREVRRVLRQDGVFYMSTPYGSMLSTLTDPAWWLLGHRHYTLKSLTTLSIRNKFLIENIQVRGALGTIGLLLNMYISKWVFKRKPFLESKFRKWDNSDYMRDGFVDIFMKLRKI